MKSQYLRGRCKRGISLLCAAAVFLSGCFGGTEIESHAAQRQYDYYVHISSSGSDETAEVNSSKAFRDIQLAYDALICRWAAAGGDSGAELGIIFDSDVTAAATDGLTTAVTKMFRPAVFSGSTSIRKSWTTSDIMITV